MARDVGMRRIALAAALLVAAAGARGQVENVRIYHGETSASSGIKLLSWGSGEARETSESVFTGARSIRLTTHGLFQGLRLVLPAPVDVKPLLDQEGAYLVMAVKQAEKGSGGAGLGSGFPGLPGPGRPGGMSGMARGGRTGPFGPGGSEFGQVNTGAVKPLANIRLVMRTTDGKAVEFMLPYDSAQRNEEQWVTLSLSSARMKALKDTSGMVTEVGIFGDQPSTILIGQLRGVRDTTPILVDPLPQRTVAVNDIVTFTGKASGGVSTLRYEWTIAPAGTLTIGNEPLPVDKEGRQFRHQFRKGGEYDVFLTVRDVAGVKKPTTVKTTVRVTL